MHRTMFAQLFVFVRLRLDPSSAEYICPSQDDGIGLRCKHDEARIGRKDTIDLYGHCSLSGNAETKSGTAYKP